MREVCDRALIAALDHGSAYADVRVLESHWEEIRTFAGEVDGIERGAESGIAIRVRMSQNWGVAAGVDFSRDGIRQLAARAAELANSGGLLMPRSPDLAAAEVNRGAWTHQVLEDPFKVPLQRKLDLLLDTEAQLYRVPAVRAVSTRLAAHREIRAFASSDGHYTLQHRMLSGAGYRAISEGAERSWPLRGGQWGTGGFELIEALDMTGSARPIGRQVGILADARPAQPGRRDLILTSRAMAALLQPLLGAHFDATRIHNRAFIESPRPQPSLDGIGSFQFGSDMLGVSYDPTLVSGAASWGYDDEGTASQAVQLIEAGRWRTALSTRQFNSRVEPALPLGATRSATVFRPPRPSVNALVMDPGDSSLLELIEDTENGLLIDEVVEVVPNLDGRLRVHAEIGWEVQYGVQQRIVAPPVFELNPASIWRQLQALGDDETCQMWGFDRSLWPLSDGLLHGVVAPCARFSNVDVLRVASAGGRS